MSETVVYAVMLRLDPETTQTVVHLRQNWLDVFPPEALRVPPGILMKGSFRACVPCGALIQRLEQGLRDFDPVNLDLGEVRWLQGNHLHWDATRLQNGQQNFDLLHLKTKLWTVSNSLVSIHCEFSPSEPFSFRTINPWQPGIILARSRVPVTQEAPVNLTPRPARGQVLDLYRLQVQGQWVQGWEHVASFAGRMTAQIMH
ncbi:hypothetical protein [Deinococcus cellulosilyticus]|uniref:Uncharacterized protein n=1 Tax=Deinococcus cellulosilyticus (strain DSM 18568 / NBRC 106333 / KACC 11606 / 5516J-15) TaxID=1223518 RepID=A0A511N2S8_DEIC1|nr:hypothetical protein [Deinococcus cellulosilyticus]GEM46736.1 hypothetical protein DC3_23710 [Deinococcus cellulosilyticus NBRC 106333 = KACC 11606]